MLICLPGSIRLPKRQFGHIKLPCRCKARIICHSNLYLGMEFSVYECERCGLSITTPDYWNHEWEPIITVGFLSVVRKNAT